MNALSLGSTRSCWSDETRLGDGEVVEGAGEVVEVDAGVTASEEGVTAAPLLSPLARALAWRSSLIFLLVLQGLPSAISDTLHRSSLRGENTRDKNNIAISRTWSRMRTIAITSSFPW